MPSPVFADTEINGTSPPYSSGTTCSATNSVLTRSKFASGLSILLIATTIGTPPATAWWIASLVCGITPSSAATTKITISVALAPRARIAVKASWPGVSKKVIMPRGVSTWYAPICWVIPPASPVATFAARILSSKEVLPWSTWPITVTTGGRGNNSASWPAVPRSKSGSSNLAACAVWPISSTIIIAVSWSKIWLIVTIWPIPIRSLITSALFTAIAWANSETVIVSGTWTSWTTFSVGTWKFVSTFASAIWRCFLRPPPERQPPTPPELSPRVFKPPGFLAPSSCQVDEVSADLIVLPPTLATTFFLSSAPSTLAGLCKVPFLASSAATSLGAFRTRAGALIMSRIAKASASAAARRTRMSVNSFSLAAAMSFEALSACAFFSAALAAAAGASSAFISISISGAAACFWRTSSAAFISASWRANNSAWRVASAARFSNSSSDIACLTGAALVAIFSGATSTAGVSATLSPALTNTRFLRTSTCTVRVRPAESAWRISEFSRLIKVIFLRLPVSALPCSFCKCSSRTVLSFSVMLSSSETFSIPAAFNCSRRSGAVRFNSLASTFTVVAIYYFLSWSKPMFARFHDERFRSFFVNLCRLN